jgi:hypothetical protein
VFKSTYDLVDSRDLGLEDGDGITDGGLLGGASNGGGSESAGGDSHERRVSHGGVGKHSIISV